MKLLQCVRDSHYIIWQLYVQMINFREYGYEKDAVILVDTKKPSELLKKFAAWTKAKVYYFDDTRSTANYSSSFRPNLIKQYLREVENPGCIFYHDQDIIFRWRVHLDHLADGPVNYVSGSARSYLCNEYLNTFTKYNHLKDMCDIVGIDQRVIDFYHKNNGIGGAQYIIKNTDYDFWDKVERDCENIYEKLRRDTAEDDYLKLHHIQIWTADMWALLYNLMLEGEVQAHYDIDFCWPWELKTNKKPIFHNAGIAPQNEMLEGGVRAFFNKSMYNMGIAPFDVSHDYVNPAVVQTEYLRYFKNAKTEMETKKFNVLGIFCTTNRINQELLSKVLSRIKAAADNATLCNVEVVTCVWEPIPGNPFEQLLSPFKNLGHLNYLLQIRQVLAGHKSDIVTMLEHDVLYPEDYFDQVIAGWDNTKYGVWNMNYVGMNDTGFLAVKQRDACFSMLSAARFYFDRHINIKLDEALERYTTTNKNVYVEPAVADFKFLPYTGVRPCIHVNMNKRGGFGTGAAGLNHHFTNHCEVCYESESHGIVAHNDWGHFRELMPV